MNIEVKIFQENENAEVRIAGEIDAFTAPILREKLAEVDVNENLQATLNFEEVNYMDSTGLGVIVAFFKNVNAHGGKVTLTGLSSRLKRLFDITGLGEIMNIDDQQKGGND
ncbi:STAS domain-containing protein [Paenisporosarcina cavernae]|uniref:Anti-sigma factor antagonist n=1 Tax=Paenisporosarcina cavernae TaxID=2320858 RepID=A0A385YXN2_9BACL|nr:STAS domain-containing protein [Paenisporosarcina cavernae]AYC30358.1 anti-sigma factor antagonist [Paenisporosarcina cavernae]